MGAVDIFVFRVDSPVLPFVVTAYHRSFRYVAVDVAVIVYKVALRWCEVYSCSLLCLFRLFFYFMLISSSSLLYFICFSLLVLLMIDLVCVGAGMM